MSHWYIFTGKPAKVEVSPLLRTWIRLEPEHQKDGMVKLDNPVNGRQETPQFAELPLRILGNA